MNEYAKAIWEEAAHDSTKAEEIAVQRAYDQTMFGGARPMDAFKALYRTAQAMVRLQDDHAALARMEQSRAAFWERFGELRR